MPGTGGLWCLLLTVSVLHHAAASSHREQSTSDCKLDLVILMDQSGSINDPSLGNSDANWAAMKQFVGTFIDYFKVGEDNAKISLVTFNSDVNTVFTMSTDQEQMQQDIQGLDQPWGWTRTAGALAAAIEIFTSDADRPGVENVVILLTDGDPTKMIDGLDLSYPTITQKNIIDEAVEEADLLRNLAEAIITIGVSEQTNDDVMIRIAGGVDNYKKVMQFNELMLDIEELLAETCGLVQSGCNVDLGILMDRSGSITDPQGENMQNWVAMSNFVMDVIEYFDNIGPRGAQIGLITFNENVKLEFNFLRYMSKQDMKNYISTTVRAPEGWTNSSGAMYHARTQLFTPAGGIRKDSKSVLLFVTDGKPTKGLYYQGQLLTVLDATKNSTERQILYDQTKDQAMMLIEMGVEILSVGVTPAVDMDLMLAVAGGSMEKFFFVENFSQLMLYVETVLNQTCFPVSSTTPRTTPVPTSTTVPTTTPLVAGDCKIDMAILVDASGSIDAAGWINIQRFVLNLALNLTRIGLRDVHLSIICFSNDAELVLALQPFDARTVQESVQNMKNKKGWTATADALMMAKESVFTGLISDGDRPDAPNFLVVVTDGKPTKSTDNTFKRDDDNSPDKINKLNNEVMDLADDLKQDGVTMLGVGVTDNVNDTLMEMMVSNEDDYFFVTEFSQLTSQIKLLTDRACAGPISSTTTTPASTTVTTPATTTSGEPAVCAIDLVILVDSSGSIVDHPQPGVGAANWNATVQFVSQIIRDLSKMGIPDARVSVICFSDSVKRVNPPQSTDIMYLADIITSLSNKGGYTATASALIEAQRVLREINREPNRGDNPDLVVLLTDGEPTKNSTGATIEGGSAQITAFHPEVEALAQAIKDGGATMFGIGVTNRTDDELMRKISDVYFKVEQFQELEDKLQEINEAACGPPPKPSTTTTTTTTKVPTTTKTAPATSTTTTTPTITQPVSGCLIDVVIVVDSSGSIGTENWVIVTQFVRNLITSLTGLGVSSMNVAVVSFSDEVVKDIEFGNITNMDELQSAIDNIEYQGGYTATSPALQAANEILDSEGNRAEAADFIIVITDGIPTLSDNGTKQEEQEEWKAEWFNGEAKMKAEMLKNRGARIIGVGVSNNIDEDLMRAIVTDENEDYFQVDQFDQLESQLYNTSSRACRPPTAPTPTTDCVVDMVVLVDSSGSIASDNWLIVKTFVQNIISGLGDIGVSGANVAVVLYSDTVETIVSFNDTNMAAVQNVVASMQHLKSYTATAPAFDAALAILKSAENRAEAFDYVLLFTDGYPTRSLNGTRIDDDKDPRRVWFNEEVAMKAAEIKSTGAVILGVGATDNVDEDLMLEVVSAPDDFFYANEFSELQNKLADLTSRACQPVGECTVDVALVVDNSGSVSDQKGLDDVKAFLTNILNSLYEKDSSVRLSLIEFSTEAKLKFDLNQYRKEEMMNIISNISSTQGWTATAAALNITLGVFNDLGGDRLDAADVLLLITDGQATVKLDGTKVDINSPVAERAMVDQEVLGLTSQLRNAGVTIVSIGVTNATNFELLRTISGRNVYPVTMFSQLNSQLSNVIDATCSIGLCSIDIAVVVDSSGSITEENWEIVKLFLEDLITQLGQIGGANGANVALISFSDRVELVSPLGTDTADVIINKTRHLEYMDSWTITPAALALVNSSVFNGSGFDRPEATNVVVLITDGRPSMSQDGSMTVHDNSVDPDSMGRRQVIEDQTIIQAGAIKNNGATIIAVGVTENVDEELMRRIVSDEDTDYLFVNEFNQLNTQINNIRSQACGRK